MKCSVCKKEVHNQMNYYTNDQGERTHARCLYQKLAREEDIADVVVWLRAKAGTDKEQALVRHYANAIERGDHVGFATNQKDEAK